jgi:hypothetical protein
VWDRARHSFAPPLQPIHPHSYDKPIEFWRFQLLVVLAQRQLFGSRAIVVPPLNIHPLPVQDLPVRWPGRPNKPRYRQLRRRVCLSSPARNPVPKAARTKFRAAGKFVDPR